MHGIDTSRKVCKHCDMLDEDIAKVKEFQAKMPELLDKYKVSPPQCTCVTDKEMICIVHPTTRSLKEYIAKLVAIADAAEIVLINTDKLFSEHRELKSLLEPTNE